MNSVLIAAILIISLLVPSNDVISVASVAEIARLGVFSYTFTQGSFLAGGNATTRRIDRRLSIQLDPALGFLRLETHNAVCSQTPHAALCALGAGLAGVTVLVQVRRRVWASWLVTRASVDGIAIVVDRVRLRDPLPSFYWPIVVKK